MSSVFTLSTLATHNQAFVGGISQNEKDVIELLMSVYSRGQAIHIKNGGNEGLGYIQRIYKITTGRGEVDPSVLSELDDKICEKFVNVISHLDGLTLTITFYLDYDNGAGKTSNMNEGTEEVSNPSAGLMYGPPGCQGPTGEKGDPGEPADEEAIVQKVIEKLNIKPTAKTPAVPKRRMIRITTDRDMIRLVPEEVIRTAEFLRIRDDDGLTCLEIGAAEKENNLFFCFNNPFLAKDILKRLERAYFRVRTFG